MSIPTLDRSLEAPAERGRALPPLAGPGTGLVRPPVAGCLGSIAACALLGKRFRLMEHRGRWFTTDQVPHLLPTIHPGYAMSHQREGYWRRVLFEDLRRIGEKLRELRPPNGAWAPQLLYHNEWTRPARHVEGPHTGADGRGDPV